jgi:hypothetical protein
MHLIRSRKFSTTNSCHHVVCLAGGSLVYVAPCNDDTTCFNLFPALNELSYVLHRSRRCKSIAHGLVREMRRVQATRELHSGRHAMLQALDCPQQQ